MGRSRVKGVQSDAPVEVVTQHAAASELVILGLRRLGRRRKVFGEFALRVARDTSCGIVMISHRG